MQQQRPPAMADGSTRVQKPLKLLALHSFRTSATIFKQQLTRGKWTSEVFGAPGAFELVFMDAPNPASGQVPRDVAPFFQGPYYEWVTVERHGDKLCFDDGKMQRSLDAVSDMLRRHAAANDPFDGLVGFSQGTAMASTMIALQAAGKALQDVPPLKFCILFAGFQPHYPAHVDAWKDKIKVPSLHVYGDRDGLRPQCKELADAFENAVVVQHTRGHSIPTLAPVHLAVVRAFLDSVAASASTSSSSSNGASTSGSGAAPAALQRQLTAAVPTQSSDDVGASSNGSDEDVAVKQEEGWQGGGSTSARSRL